MFYRLLLAIFVVTVVAHCGKPHHGKHSKPSTTITAPQDSPDERDAA